MDSPTTYVDARGRRYRPAGRVPYAELAVGTPFTLEGDTWVYFRSMPRKPDLAALGPLAALSTAVYNRRVILLEPLAP